jgi:hypothetical protein
LEHFPAAVLVEAKLLPSKARLTLLAGIVETYIAITSTARQEADRCSANTTFANFLQIRDKLGIA